MAQPSMLLLSRFQGCLAGAVIGDCIGAVFEGFWADSIAIEKILEEVNKISTGTLLKSTIKLKYACLIKAVV